MKNEKKTLNKENEEKEEKQEKQEKEEKREKQENEVIEEKEKKEEKQEKQKKGEKVNIQCPFGLEQISNVNNNAKKEYLELVELHCNNCKDSNNICFLIIWCSFCEKAIYIKKNKDNQPLNGMNGINIKCPYNSCGKYFYITICPKCRKNQKIPKIIKEGEIIQCKNEDCAYQYLQVRCPKVDCKEITYFCKPKNNSNNPNGILYNHKSELVFQKISCNFCIRPIVYESKKDSINRYFDSMKIICPYESCKKEFNRIVCPICSEINIIENGLYFMGHKIKCFGCKNYFAKILCPKCLKVNPFINTFFQSGEFICRYTLCSQKSYIVNCIHCRKMNVFNNNDKEHPIPGQQIICAYDDCRKAFNEVYCPGCNGLNPFPEGNFLFGKTYKCDFSFCKKIYQFLVCPDCLTYATTLDPQEGKKYSCNKCKTLLSNWGCPFCNKTIMDKNSSLEYGQVVQCPGCKKEYSFCRCYNCQKLIFNEENRSILGLSVKCKECDSISVNILCPKCNSKICIIDRMNDMVDGEKIKCTKCGEDFEYNTKMNQDIYKGNLSVLKNIKGEKINFGKSNVDENYLSVENLLINSNLYKKNENDKTEKDSIKNNNNKICIVCHCDNKESVFYPCKHRCTCYKCAIYFFKVFKKCPKCNEAAEAIIPRVYEI